MIDLKSLLCWVDYYQILCHKSKAPSNKYKPTLLTIYNKQIGLKNLVKIAYFNKKI